MIKKISTIMMIFIMIKTPCMADDLEVEEVDIQQIQEEVVQTAANVAEEPKIDSRAAVVIDRESKRILYSKNCNEKRAMASTTKIMTAIIALENSRLEEKIIVSKQPAKVGGPR